MLPQIQYPIIRVTIPSTKEERKFRPFLVKEEKILLMAKESKKDRDVFQAIVQIVNNCSLDSLDVEALTLFDLEWVFLKLRIASVSDVVDVSYTDMNDSRRYDFEVDLEKVTVKWPEKLEYVIPITDEAGLKMRYPRAAIYGDDELFGSDEFFFELILKCIESVYDGETVYSAKDYSHEELTAFVEQLDVKTYERVLQFLNDVPTLFYVIEYKNSFDEDKKIELRTLNDFFTFR